MEGDCKITMISPFDESHPENNKKSMMKHYAHVSGEYFMDSRLDIIDIIHRYCSKWNRSCQQAKIQMISLFPQRFMI